MSGISPSKCSSCGEATTNRCLGCKSVVYCNPECQGKDWPNHKTACMEKQLEKVLERVADILQEAYLKFRELTWDMPIKKVEVDTREIITYDGPLTDELFVAFPHHLMSDSSIKSGILCHLVCQDPFAFMHQLILYLLEGLRVSLTNAECTLTLKGYPVQIEEVNVNLKNIPRKSTTVVPGGGVQSNWPVYSHQMLQLTSTKGAKVWYIDITGAQYGLHRALWVARDFNSIYVTRIQNVNAFGAAKELLTVQAEKNTRPGLILRKCFQAASHMNSTVCDWTNQHKIRLAALVKLKEQAFEAKKADLLEAMGLAVKDYILDTDFSEELRPILAGPQLPLNHKFFS